MIPRGMVASQQSAPIVLGRYALYDPIASGGMATVHLGRLLGPVGFARTVAIKRLHAHYAQNPEFVSMFLDEARLVARIRHPNVVPTLDVVATEGALFLVMEYVQGESLLQLFRVALARDERIAPPMSATLLAGVLEGLHAAHEARDEQGQPLGIVHRDVSPQNILVGTDGIARVLDFGVAKAAGRVQTTRDGQLKGRIAYMAPEQLRGTVTRASDVYAASVVLWEALVGRGLFRGESDAEIMSKVMAAAVVPPSRLAPDIPRALDAAVMRGLSFDPARRFATARDMARALEDAVPLVGASKIGAWVEAAACETLSVRSARIAAIESSSGIQGPAALLAAVDPGPVSSSAAPAPASIPVAPPPSSFPASLPIEATEPPRTGRLVAAVVGGLAAAAIVGTAVVALWMLHSGSAARDAVVVSPPEPAPPPLSSAPPALAVETVTLSALLAPSASSEPGASAAPVEPAAAAPGVPSTRAAPTVVPHATPARAPVVRPAPTDDGMSDRK
jgi:eukaryotic-like serine/threonine-protein kinase